MPMTWTPARDYEEMCDAAATRVFAAIARRLGGRRPMLLGLATGNTMLGLYDRLVAILNGSGLDLSRLHTVNLDEYVSADGEWIAIDHPLSYRGYMRRNLFERLDPALGFDPRHIRFPDPGEPAALDEWIRDMGGLDFQLLGIGFNGHVGFNEPMSAAAISGDAFAALPSRVVDLTELTIETNARLTAAGDRSKVPPSAATLGMGSILAAREILLLACFPEQRRPLRELRRGVATPELPASYLGGHPDCTILYAEDRVLLEER